MLLLSLILTPSFMMVGQDATVKKVEEDPKNPSQLVADKVTLKRELVLTDSVMMEMQRDEEDEEFLSEDLYGDSWNTDHVKAYGGTAIPDSFRVDVSSFVMPVEGKITSKFGPRRRRFHYGTDIKLQTGDTVRAAFDGKIRVKRYERRGYGYFLVLRHSNGLETVYGHLSEFLVDADDVVKAGDPIALGGNTGRSFGSHLHFEMRFLGMAINPEDIVDFDNYTVSDDYYVFQKNKVSESNRYASSGKASYYRIRSGDTLGGIARKQGVSVKQLCRLNGLRTSSTLRIGRVLRCS